ncbi:phage tail tape measure protein [Xanthobacter sp. KR7-65]|uniref:phage tail tape measure protein n=1 Tax=Xanthobacter sp. KR7-65 TaxID=3156612 RepID=UPI0032B5AA29
MRTMEARAVISAVDKTGNVFRQVAGKINHLQAASTRVGRASASVSRSGATALAAIGRFAAPAALAAGAVAASKNFAAYDRQLSYLANTADATAEQMAGVRKEIGATSRLVAETPDEVLKGTQTFISALGDLDIATKATRETARAAKAFGTDITDQAAAGVAVVQNLGIAVDRLNRANEIMAAGANIGMFEPRDMAKHLPSIAAAAKELKVVGEAGLGKLVAHLEVVRTATGDSATAANDYYNLLSKIVAPSTIDAVNDMAKDQKKNIDLLKELDKGYANGTDAVQTFLRVVRELTKGDPNKIKELVPDMQANRALTALIALYDSLDDKIRTVLNSVGLVDRAFARVMKDQQSNLDRMTQAFDRLMKLVGENTGLNAAAGVVAAGINARVDVGEMTPSERDAYVEQSQRNYRSGVADAAKRDQEEADRRRAADLPSEIALVRQRGGRNAEARVMALEEELRRLQGQGSAALQGRRWDAATARLAAQAWPEPALPPPTFAPLPGPAPLPPPNPLRRRPRRSGNPPLPAERPLPPVNPMRFPSIPEPADVGAVQGGQVKAVVEGPVTATVTGQADVNVKIQIDAPAWMKAVVTEALKPKMNLRSAPTGRSMPEAEPPGGQWPDSGY